MNDLSSVRSQHHLTFKKGKAINEAKIIISMTSEVKSCVTEKMSEIQIGETNYLEIMDINGERVTTNMKFKSGLTAEQNSMEVRKCVL